MTDRGGGKIIGQSYLFHYPGLYLYLYLYLYLGRAGEDEYGCQVQVQTKQMQEGGEV